MTSTTDFNPGDYIEMRNAKGDVVVRIVYLGDGNVQEYRQYRNLMTNEISDWRPADNSKPVAMNTAMIAEFAQKIIRA